MQARDVKKAVLFVLTETMWIDMAKKTKKTKQIIQSSYIHKTCRE